MHLPLTERILSRLPGPRWLWIGIWVLVPLAVILEGQRRDPSPLFPNTPFLVAFIYTVIASFQGTRWLNRSLATIEPMVADLLPAQPSEPFRSVDRIDGPLLLTAAMMVAFPVNIYLNDPRLSTAWSISMVGLLTVPLVTLGWTIGSIFLGLSRLGRIPLTFRPFESDRSLGLRPLGVLAFRTVLLYVVVFLPSTIMGSYTIYYAAVLSAMNLAVVFPFFGSLWGLRRQLLTAKARHVTWARDRYARAFRAVRDAPSPAAVRELAPELEIAEAFERRAESIQEWPFDDRILRTLAAVFSSIVTAVIVRLILIQVGL